MREDVYSKHGINATEDDDRIWCESQENFWVGQAACPRTQDHRSIIQKKFQCILEQQNKYKEIQSKDRDYVERQHKRLQYRE